ncbi:hypothetical protein ACFKO2_001287 [Escherichia coli]
MKNNTQPALKERIEKALEDFTKGRASMHVPPLDTDVDVVLAECSDRLSELKARCAALAAENAGLKAVESNLVRNIINDLGDTEFQYEKVQTPATDAFLDEVRADARNEGINYTASRLAAAFNHGFVDKPLAEVCDVVRMILDTKEELANSTLPSADGISGEYAEKFLAEFAAQLRKEASTAELVADGAITKVGE